MKGYPWSYIHHSWVVKLHEFWSFRSNCCLLGILHLQGWKGVETKTKSQWNSMKYSSSVRIYWLSCNLSLALAVIFVDFHSQRRLEPQYRAPIRGVLAVMGNACPHRSQVTQILVHQKILTKWWTTKIQQKCHCYCVVCLCVFVFGRSRIFVQKKVFPKRLDTPFHWKKTIRVGEISCNTTHINETSANHLTLRPVIFGSCRISLVFKNPMENRPWLKMHFLCNIRYCPLPWKFSRKVTKWFNC